MSFDFDKWCKDNELPDQTIALLTEEHFTECNLILEIDIGWITDQTQLKQGEKVRLRLAIEKLRSDLSTPASTTEKGAVGGFADGFLFDGTRPKVKQEPQSPGPASGLPHNTAPSDRVTFPTTRSLAQHQQTKAQVAAFLSNPDQLSSLQELLSLVGIQAAVQNPSGGERDRLVDKPLLIKDFIKSNINRQYTSIIKEVALNDNTKIVVEDKGSNLTKKPEVKNYTTEIWASANNRIILHLLSNNTPRKIVSEYVEYSGWICDYLDIYVQRGVFCLDEQHRLRVHSEGRAWNDLYAHDSNQWLIPRRNPSEFSASTDQKGGKSKKATKKSGFQRSKKQLDTSGVPVCFNYNSKKGCEDENCIYSHVCNNPGCLGNHSCLDCGRVGPRFQKK